MATAGIQPVRWDLYSSCTSCSPVERLHFNKPRHWKGKNSDSFFVGKSFYTSDPVLIDVKHWVAGLYVSPRFLSYKWQETPGFMTDMGKANFLSS